VLGLLAVLVSLIEHLAAYFYLGYCIVVGVQAVRDRNQPEPRPDPPFGYPFTWTEDGNS
jgi:hypothetical protein